LLSFMKYIKVYLSISWLCFQLALRHCSYLCVKFSYTMSALLTNNIEMLKIA
jgi:hypothetical protein